MRHTEASSRDLGIATPDDDSAPARVLLLAHNTGHFVAAETRRRLATIGDMPAWRGLLAAVALLAGACTSASSPDAATTTTTTMKPATTTTIGDEPAAEPDGVAVWAASEAGEALTLVTLDPAAARTVRLSGPAHNVAVTAEGLVVATLPTRGRLAFMRDGQASEVDVGGSPHDVKPAGDALVVTNGRAARVDVVRPDGTTQAKVTLRARPHDVAVTPDGRTAWVTLDGSADLAVIDLGAGSVARYVATRLRPHDLLFSPDGRLWVTGWDGTLAVLDQNGQEVSRLDVAAEAHHLAFTDDGGEVWVTDSSGRRVVIVDTRSTTIVASLPLAGTPHHVAILDGRAVVADNQRAMAVVFDVETRTLVDEVAVASGPHGVAAVRR